MRNFPTLYVIAKPLLITYICFDYSVSYIFLSISVNAWNYFTFCLAVHILFIETITIIAQVMWMNTHLLILNIYKQQMVGFVTIGLDFE